MNSLVTSSLSRINCPLYYTHGICLMINMISIGTDIDNVEWIAHLPYWAFPNDNLRGNIFFAPRTKVIFSFISSSFNLCISRVHQPRHLNTTRKTT